MLLEILPSVCVVFFGLYYLLGSEASCRAKWIVGILIAGSIILQFGVPGLWLFRLILQIMIGIYLLLYFRVNP